MSVDYGLNASCYSGMRDVVEYMISKGGSDWNAAFKSAAGADDLELLELFVSKGADNFEEAFFDFYVTPRVIKYALSLGAVRFFSRSFFFSVFIS